MPVFSGAILLIIIMPCGVEVCDCVYLMSKQIVIKYCIIKAGRLANLEADTVSVRQDARHTTSC